MAINPNAHGSLCCVVGCSNRVGTDRLQGIVRKYHHFPSAETKAKRRQMWIDAIPRAGWTPTQRSVICGDHFVGGKQLW